MNAIDLALNNQQWLIYHETNLNQTFKKLQRRATQHSTKSMTGASPSEFIVSYPRHTFVAWGGS